MSKVQWSDCKPWIHLGIDPSTHFLGSTIKFRCVIKVLPLLDIWWMAHSLLFCFSVMIPPHMLIRTHICKSFYNMEWYANRKASFVGLPFTFIFSCFILYIVSTIIIELHLWYILFVVNHITINSIIYFA